MVLKTNREVIAEAYPLHFQRIVEAAYAEDEKHSKAWLGHASGMRPKEAMAGLFFFARSTEGHQYWADLVQL